MHGQAPRDLADLVFREHTVAANELKRISAMHECYLRVRVRVYCRVSSAVSHDCNQLPTPRPLLLL